LRGVFALIPPFELRLSGLEDSDRFAVAAETRLVQRDGRAHGGDRLEADKAETLADIAVWGAGSNRKKKSRRKGEREKVRAEKDEKRIEWAI
jgi:hypothetical protein